MIVRRGATPRYEALRQKTKHLNVEVVWDRREGDGNSEPAKAEVAKVDAAKASADRAFQNRRRTPPFTWDVADFVVVVPKVKRSPRK